MTLAVERAWKATTSERIAVSTGAPCAYSVSSDEVHLLFIQVTPSGELATARCLGNGVLASRQTALTWLHHNGKRMTVTSAQDRRR